MIEDLLKKADNISGVEILKNESLVVKGVETHKTIGKFIKDEMRYSFVNLRTELVNYLAIRFQFIYTAKVKKVSRNDVLEVVNSMNKEFPSVKVFLNDINAKEIKVNFNVEIPYKGDDAIERIFYPAIDVVAIAPHFFAVKLTDKGIDHKSIS